MASNPTEPRPVNRWARWTLRALLPAALLLCPRAARAEDTFKPPPKLPAFLHLEYDRGALKSCPEREALEDAIIAAAGRDPLNDVAPARLRVAITRRGAAYAAIIEVRDAAGALVWRRPWDAPLASCPALVSALGFLVGSELREVPPASPQAPAPTPAKGEPAPVPALVPAMPAPEQAKVDLPPAPSHAPIRLNVGAASAVGIRTAAPLVTFNLTASAGLRWRSFSGALEFRWTPPEDAVVNSVGRELVHVMQYAGRVVPCGHFHALVYCGVGEVSAIVTKGVRDTMAVTAAAMPSIATGLRFGADFPVPILGRRLVFRPWMDALVTVRDVRIRFDDGRGSNGGEAPAPWMTPRLSVFFGAGILTDLRLK